MKRAPKNLQDHLVVIHNLLFIGAIVIIVATLFQNTPFFWILEILGILILIVSVLYKPGCMETGD